MYIRRKEERGKKRLYVNEYEKKKKDGAIEREKIEGWRDRKGRRGGEKPGI